MFCRERCIELLFPDMSGTGSVLAWVIPAVLGSSVVSTLITAYVTQSGERRRARAEVRAVLRVAESTAAEQEATGPQMRAALDEFARVAQLARLPYRLVDLHFVANNKVWDIRHLPMGESVSRPVLETALRVSSETFSLVVDATWHPYRSRWRVWRRIRRYRRILVAGVPELDREYAWPRHRRRSWEREMLRKERRERSARGRVGSTVRQAGSSLPPDIP